MKDSITSAILNAVSEGKSLAILRRFLRIKYKVDFSKKALDNRINRLQMEQSVETV